MTALVCSLLLTLALGVYIFYPEKRVTAQTEKPRLEYLAERKAQLYDNLRDLSFEHRAGKYRDEEYQFERDALEAEAAIVVAEMDAVEGREGRPHPGERPAVRAARGQ